MANEGQDAIQNLQNAGFSTDQVGAWQAQKSADLTAAGFSNDEVNSYFGQNTPNDQPLQDHFNNVIGQAADAAKGDGTTDPKPFTMMDAIDAGWQHSTTGLAMRQQVPDMTLPENNNWYQRLAYNTSSMAGDIPAMGAGFMVGAGGGAETGPGALITGTAGAFAMPAALRSVMMDAYSKGDYASPGDFLARAGGILLDTAKSYVTGAATGTAGAVAAPALAAAGLSGVGLSLGVSGSELAAMVTTSKAMEGQLPSANDFMDAAVMLGGFKAVPFLAGKVQSAFDAVTGKNAVPSAAPTGEASVTNPAANTEIPTPVSSDGITLSGLGQNAGNLIDTIKGKTDEIASTLRNIYKQTNLHPSDVAMDAANDPTIHQDVVGNPGEIPDAYKDLIDPMFKAKDETATEAEMAPDQNADVASDKAPEAEAVPEPGTLESAQKAILDKVEVGGTDQKSGMTFNNFYARTVDSMDPLKQEVEAMTNGKDLPASKDPYVLARLTRGFYGKADQFLQHSPYDFNTYKNTGESLKSILDPYKDDLQGVRAFVVAKRAQELESRGINSGFDPVAVEKVVKDSGDKYGDVGQKLVDYSDNVTKYLKDSGVLSNKSYDAMREANKSFVPFYRVMDPESVSGGVGKGFGVFDPIKRIKGSDRAVIDPLESIIKNTYSSMAIADRNEVASRFIELAKKSDDPSQFIEKVKTPVKPITVGADEMQKFLGNHGVDNVPDDLMTIFRGAQKQLGDDEIAVYKNGNREVYKVNPDVAAVFKQSDSEALNWIFKILAKPAGMLRAGVTLSPDFFPRHLIRQQFNALIYSKSGFIPLLDTVRGAASMISHDDAYQNWLKSGGANATMVALDRSYIQNNIMKLDQETGFKDSAWNILKSPLEMLRAVSELTENATRVGEFRKSLGDNTDKSSIQQAGFDSREVTVDAARIGSKVSAVNQLISFFNITGQDMDRFIRASKENPLGTAAKVAAGIVAPSVALWYANHDDPRYKDIAQWQKDLFWLVMTKDHIFRIPKPYGPGILFGSGIERFLDYAHDQDPTLMKHFGSDLLSTVTPGAIPNFAAPMLEQWANKSFFTGNKIIPSSTEELLPEVQYQPYTTETAKALGKMVGTLPPENQPGTIASPAIIENYIRDWSGGLGMYALQIADKGLRMAGVLPDPSMPASTLADIPFIKSFIVRYPSAGAQPIEDFYDRYAESKQTLMTMQYLAKQGDFASASKLAQMNPQALVKMDGIKTSLSNTQRLIQMVTKNPQMSPVDKRQLIDSTYYQMINMARTGNDLMRNIDQTMAK